MSEEITYRVRRTKRTGRILLKIHHDGVVELIVPYRVSLAAAERFFASKKAWVATILKKYPSVQRSPIGSGTRLMCFGQQYMVTVTIRSGRSALSVRGHELGVKVADMRKVKALVETWYRSQAKDFFRDSVRQLPIGAPVSIRITGAKTRWGSCQPQKRQLMFNWRLALAPLSVAQYVLSHEVAHLTHHNHSRQFWARVEELQPGYMPQRAWLKKHGHELVL